METENSIDLKYLGRIGQYFIYLFKLLFNRAESVYFAVTDKFIAV